jgi:hypothetical protein
MLERSDAAKVAVVEDVLIDLIGEHGDVALDADLGVAAKSSFSKMPRWGFAAN